MRIWLFAACSFVFFLTLSCGPFEQESTTHISVFLHGRNRTGFANPSMTFNLSCTQTFGGLGTFTQNSIVISGTSGIIQVLASTACTLSLQSFFDGTSTYTPSASSLVVTITNAGSVSWSGTPNNPPSYVNGANAKVYLFVVSATVSSLSFEYTFDPVVQSVTFVGP